KCEKRGPEKTEERGSSIALQRSQVGPAIEETRMVPLESYVECEYAHIALVSISNRPVRINKYEAEYRGDSHDGEHPEFIMADIFELLENLHVSPSPICKNRSLCKTYL